eukprot:10536035-Heterocapsa_arctica.AAC.1
MEEYHNKENSCRNPGGCLMCKAFGDSHQSLKIPINSETTKGMTEWIKKMRTDKDWLSGDVEKNMLMTFCHLGTKEMKTERNHISQYGA